MNNEVAYTLPSKNWAVLIKACKRWAEWGLPEETKKFLGAVAHKVSTAVECDGKKTIVSTAENWERLLSIIWQYPTEWEASAEVLEIVFQLDMLSGDYFSEAA